MEPKTSKLSKPVKPWFWPSWFKWGFKARLPVVGQRRRLKRELTFLDVLLAIAVHRKHCLTGDWINKNRFAFQCANFFVAKHAKTSQWQWKNWNVFGSLFSHSATPNDLLSNSQNSCLNLVQDMRMYHYSQHSAALQPAVPENFKMPILDQEKPRASWNRRLSLQCHFFQSMSTSSILLPSPRQLRPPKCPAGPPSHHNLHFCQPGKWKVFTSLAPPKTSCKGQLQLKPLVQLSVTSVPENLTHLPVYWHIVVLHVAHISPEHVQMALVRRSEAQGAEIKTFPFVRPSVPWHRAHTGKCRPPHQGTEQYLLAILVQDTSVL